GELDLAFGMTGKLLPRVMSDPNLRWDPNYTGPWWLMFPGYNEPGSPFRDKRVRQAVSLAINRPFLIKQETQGIGKPTGNWIGGGRKSYPGNRNIVQNIDPRAGGAKANIAVYAVCDSPSSFICDPQIEALWKKHQASLDLGERERLVKQIQRIILDEHYFVPIYLNPFVHAVGPRVLPEGDGFHRYWDTLNASYPWPWEIREVKADR